MSYGNNWSFSRGSGFTKSPYRSNGYNSGFNRSNFNNGPKKKHSGAKFGYTHGDASKPYVSAWNYSKQRGLISLIASPYVGKNSRTKEHRSGNGRVWENWRVKVFVKRTMQTLWFGCLYDTSTQKITIPDMGFVLNHKAPNGGYCGTFRKK